MSNQFLFVRNASVYLNYGGQSFLIDPMFAEKGALGCFPGTVNSEIPNPTVDLALSIEKLVAADTVLLTHLHPDHWDEAAARLIDKNRTVYLQNEEDAAKLQAQGFQKTEVIKHKLSIGNVQIERTKGQHGSDLAYSIPELAKFLGESSGYYLQAEGQASIYFLGDTILTQEVEADLKRLAPDYVVINAGAARLADATLGAIIMGKEEIAKIHQLLPKSKLVAIHLEALAHCVLSRKELRQFAEEQGFSSQLIIPKDGASFSF